MKPLVTVITSSAGNPLLPKCIESVQKQTYRPIQHLIFVDGKIPLSMITHNGCDTNQVIEREPVTKGERTLGVAKYQRDWVLLPYATGTDRFNGHRNLAAGVYLAKGEYVCFLDDDNTMEPEHIESCIDALKYGDLWSFSLRNIVDKDHKFICQDNCESLGLWASVCGPQDYFVDMNCYFLPKNLALAITPIMHRKFREPGQMEVDRAMVWALRQMNTKYVTTGKYTINYAVGNSQHSVQGGFFLHGNEIMNKHYNGVFPWNQ